MTLTTDPRLLRRCHANWVAQFSWIARSIPGGTVEPCGTATVVRTGLASSGWNPVLALDPPDDVAELADRIERTLVRTRTRWVLITTALTSNRLAQVIERFGLVRRLTVPGLAKALGPERPASAPPGFEVLRVTEPEQLPALVGTVSAAYDAPAQLFEAWREVPIGPSTNPAFYVGWHGDKAVSAAMRFDSDGIAGIHFVCTLEAFRHRGYGTEITRRAAADGRDVGCTSAYLQATELGRPVYERMGYRTVEEYDVWVPKLAAVPRGPPNP